MRRIVVKVITNAKKNCVIETHEKYKVYVTAPPIDDRANKLVLEILAEFFKIKKYQIKIIKGQHAKEKIIEIDTLS